MAAARQPEPTTNIAPHAAVVGVLAGVASLYFQFPGFAIIWVAFIVAGHIATPPQLTGGNTGRGRTATAPKPANPFEEKQLSRYRMWTSLKWSLLVPKDSWFPIWPGKRREPVQWMANSKFPALQKLSGYALSQVEDQFLFYVAAGAAVLGAAIPVTRATDIIGTEYDWLLRLLDAVGIYITILGVNAAIRQNASPEDPAPPISIQHYLAMFTDNRRGKAIGAGIGAIVAAFIADLAFGVITTKFNWIPVAILPVQTWMVTLAVIPVIVGLILHFVCRTDALTEWRDLVQARADWEPRWSGADAKLDTAPRLIAHKNFGDTLTVDTFDAPAVGGGNANFLQMTSQLSLLMGSGKKLAILDEPDVDVQGQPVPGSMSPTRFRIATWHLGELPDLSTTDVDPELLQFAVASAMTWAVTDDGHMGRCVPMSIDSIAAGLANDDNLPIWEGDSADDEYLEYDEDGNPIEQFTPDQPAQPEIPVPGAWASQFAFPDGGALAYVQMQQGAISGYLGVEVIVDTKANTVYFGALTNGAPEFIDPGLAKHFVEMETEARWNRRWQDILKMGARQPVPQHNVYMEAKIPVGPGGRRETIHCQPMVIPQGVSILEYLQPPKPYEPQLSTTLVAAPFVSITGLSGLSGIKPGDRHKQAIAVYWSPKQLPTNPDAVVPSEDNKGAGWLLAGLVNNAFDVSRLQRPEMIDAVPMTDKTSRGHMWKMRLKLYGGVTIADVRNNQQKIRQAMQSQWLRVADAGDGIIIIVAGAKPGNPGFQFAKTLGRRMSNEDYVIQLDWEQAFLVSKVVGDGGKLPTLVNSDTLPKNPDVHVLDFDMPPGVTRGQIKSATQLLMGATDNGYVDVKPSPNGAKQVRLYVAKVSPLPDAAGVDWDAVDGFKGPLPFATGVAGEPVAYDNKSIAHLLVAGASGGGKSVALQVLLYDAAVQDCEIYVVDPTKGGADFGFVKPYSKAFASTVDEAAALMKYLYAEVLRRKEMNVSHQVGSYRDLPEDIRPRHIYLMMDEFTSLMQPDAVSKTVSDDPEIEEDRQMQLRANQAKAYIGTMTGKIAREARSVGVTLILATQKLTAKMLDNIPGASDLKLLTMDTNIPVPVSERFPNGWATNADLVVGDLVYTPYGNTTPILGFTDIVSDRPVHRVTFDDGQTVDVDAGHLWQAADMRSRRQHGRTDRGENGPWKKVVRARELLDSIEPGVWMSPSEIAQALGYLATQRILDLATKFGTPRGMYDRLTGNVRTYNRDERRGTAPKLFHAPTAAAIISQSGSTLAAAMGELVLDDNLWLTARELTELASRGPVSASTAGNVGTTLLKFECPSIEQEHAPFVYDAHHFISNLLPELTSMVAVDSEGAALPLERIVTTQEMLGTLVARGSHSNWAIRLPDAFDGPDADLLIDPYVLGAWLGDGSANCGLIASGGSATCTDSDGVTDQDRMLDQLRNAGVEANLLSSNMAIGTRGLQTKLRTLGVLNNKHIPAVYMRASAAQRLALLQGLMDTDGTVHKRSNQCSILQVRRELSVQIMELARSLGIKATWSEWDASYRLEGWTEKKVTGRAYSVQFRTNLPVFRLPRKLARMTKVFKESSRTQWRYVKSIEVLDAQPMRCIGVADESHLFLVEGFIPTHNTNLGRMLLGNATQGDRASALKNFVDAPSLGDHIPRGRGLYEGDGLAEVIQVWFEGSQDTYAQKLAERRPPLTEDEMVNLEALIPKPTQISEFSVVGGTAPAQDAPRQKPSFTSPAEEIIEIEDLGEMEVDFDSLLAEFEEERATEHDAGVDEAMAFLDGMGGELPSAPPVGGDFTGLASEMLDDWVSPAPTADGFGFPGAAAVGNNDHSSNVVFLDVEGVVTPIGRMAGDPAWGDWAPSDFPGMGAAGVSPRMLSHLGTLPASLVWCTDWPHPNEMFAPAVGRGELPVLYTGTSEHGWWKLDAVESWLAENPWVRKVVWVDEKLGQESPLGITWAEAAEEIFDHAGVESLLAGTSPEVGFAVDEVEYVRDWLGGGDFGVVAPVTPAPLFEVEAAPVYAPAVAAEMFAPEAAWGEQSDVWPAQTVDAWPMPTPSPESSAAASMADWMTETAVEVTAHAAPVAPVAPVAAPAASAADWMAEMAAEVEEGWQEHAQAAEAAAAAPEPVKPATPENLWALPDDEDIEQAPEPEPAVEPEPEITPVVAAPAPAADDIFADEFSPAVTRRVANTNIESDF